MALQSFALTCRRCVITDPVGECQSCGNDETTMIFRGLEITSGSRVWYVPDTASVRTTNTGVVFRWTNDDSKRISLRVNFADTIYSDNAALFAAISACFCPATGGSGGSDGNDAHLVRGNTTAAVAPTVGEIATPLAGDTAKVFLTDGKIEFWGYTTLWTLNKTVSVRRTVRTVSASGALLSTDDIIIASGTVSLSLPATGSDIDVKNYGTGTVTVTGNLDTGTSFPLASFPLSSGESQGFAFVSANQWAII